MNKHCNFFFLIILLSISNGSFAQDHCYNCDTDSLKNQLKLKKTPAEKVNRYVETEIMLDEITISFEKK